MIDRKKLYDLIYAKADRLLKKYNPCQINKDLFGGVYCKKYRDVHKIYLGMTLQSFLLSEEGKSAQLQFRNDKAQIKQQLWVYKYDTDDEQCFLFRDGILADWVAIDLM